MYVNNDCLTDGPRLHFVIMEKFQTIWLFIKLSRKFNIVIGFSLEAHQNQLLPFQIFILIKFKFQKFHGSQCLSITEMWRVTFTLIRFLNNSHYNNNALL